MNIWFSNDMRVKIVVAKVNKDRTLEMKAFYPTIDVIMANSIPHNLNHDYSNGGRVWRPRDPDTFNFLTTFRNWRLNQ